jgi:hypothetical protein
MVFQRRLSAAADKFRVLGDDRGLSAGRKPRRPESDGKALNDVPDTRGREALIGDQVPVMVRRKTRYLEW